MAETRISLSEYVNRLIERASHWYDFLKENHLEGAPEPAIQQFLASASEGRRVEIQTWREAEREFDIRFPGGREDVEDALHRTGEFEAFQNEQDRRPTQHPQQASDSAGGVTILPFLAYFGYANSMEQDWRYRRIVKRMLKDWNQANPEKRFRDELYVVDEDYEIVLNPELIKLIPYLKPEADKQFVEKYKKRAERYSKQREKWEQEKAYNQPFKDPVFRQFLRDVDAETSRMYRTLQAAGERPDWDEIEQDVRFHLFKELNHTHPEKAEKYARLNPITRKAHQEWRKENTGIRNNLRNSLKITEQIAIPFVSSNTIRGTVVDNKRKPLPNTQILVTRKLNGQIIITAITSGAGNFSISKIPNGVYIISFSHAGPYLSRTYTVNLKNRPSLPRVIVLFKLKSYKKEKEEEEKKEDKQQQQKQKRRIRERLRRLRERIRSRFQQLLQKLRSLGSRIQHFASRAWSSARSFASRAWQPVSRVGGQTIARGVSQGTSLFARAGGLFGGGGAAAGGSAVAGSAATAGGAAASGAAAAGGGAAAAGGAATAVGGAVGGAAVAGAPAWLVALIVILVILLLIIIIIIIYVVFFYKPPNDTQAELVIAKQVDKTEILLQRLNPFDNEINLTYTIRVSYNGEADAILITDPIPEGITFQSAEGPGEITAPSQGSDTGTVSWRIPLGTTTTTTSSSPSATTGINVDTYTNPPYSLPKPNGAAGIQYTDTDMTKLNNLGNLVGQYQNYLRSKLTVASPEKYIDPFLAVIWSGAIEGIKGNNYFWNCNASGGGSPNQGCTSFSSGGWQVGFGIQVSQAIGHLAEDFNAVYGDNAAGNADEVQRVGQAVLDNSTNSPDGRITNPSTFPRATIGDLIGRVTTDQAAQQAIAILLMDEKLGAVVVMREIAGDILGHEDWKSAMYSSPGDYYETHMQEFSNNMQEIAKRYTGQGGSVSSGVVGGIFEVKLHAILKPGVNDAHVVNTATAEVINPKVEGTNTGSSTVGTPDGGSSSSTTPNQSTCNGVYASGAKNINDGGQHNGDNFGDPTCELAASFPPGGGIPTLLRDEIVRLDPQNVGIWLNIAACEAPGYDPNNVTNFGKSYKPWGLFQMGASGHSGGDGWVDDPYKPGDGLNGPYDRGDVNWRQQVSNAIDYHNKKLNGGWSYWECADQCHLGLWFNPNGKC